jgi:hypothetical protein
MRNWLLVALFAACTPDTGTLRVDLVTAPESDLLSRIETLEVRVGAVETRAVSNDAGRLAVAFEFNAFESGELELEGFDEDGGLIAVGRTGLLPLNAFDADIAVYVAPPLSIGAAPVALPTPRLRMATLEMPSGVLLAGGASMGGDVTDEVFYYAALRHDLLPVTPLPAARAGLATALGDSGLVYLYGGVDAEAAPQSTIFSFDGQAVLNARYGQYDGDSVLARADASIAKLDGERFLLTGDPTVLLEGVLPSAQTGAIDGALLSLSEPGAPLVLAFGAGAGATGVASSAGAGFESIEAPASAVRTGHGAMRVGKNALAVGGEAANLLLTTAIAFARDSGAVTEVPLLARGRNRPAVASTDRYVVVFGGEDELGAPLDDAEVFDAESLAPIAVLPLTVPRTNAEAIPLRTGQILLVGGTDAAGMPTAVLELFTPPL